jgi:hypothetical protein
MKASPRLGFIILLVGIFFTCRPAIAQSPSTVGQWSPVMIWPFINTHSVLLPNGKVLWWPPWADGDNPTIWDPVANTNTAISPAGYNIFCAGLAVMGNGQVLITGGDASTEVGPPNAVIYDPVANTWTQIPDMNEGRWYPTNTPLPNGDVLVISGEISPSLGNDPLPQIWQPSSGTWRNLTTAQLSLALYPEMFIAPNGYVFYAAPFSPSRYLDTTGTGGWAVGPPMKVTPRDYGPAVTYAPGKIILIGGNTPPTPTAEIIDLNAPAPSWTLTSSMSYPRRQANATLLPDGTVLVTGGSSGNAFDDATHPVFPAELWNPDTGKWTILASLSVYRGYHSIALLLPDGRVLSAGGSYPSAEVFSPPYLFNGPRPTISFAPATSSTGQTFFVGTPDASSITKVSLIRLGATTHSFNENQGVAFPSFTQASGGLNVTLPSNANLLPNGDYMLFLVNSSGIPSVASFIRLTNSASPPPVISFSKLSLNFPIPQRVGTISGPGPITVTNLGTSSVSFGSTLVSGPDFAVSSNTCTAGLAAGGTCQISVVFQPTIAGPLNETLTVNDSDPSSPQVIALSGVAGALKVSATSFNLGSVSVGKTASTKAVVTLTNVASSTLGITGRTYSDSEFTEDPSSTCGSSLAASASCIVTTNFTPNTTGTRTGNLTITYSDPASPTVILFSGVGLAAAGKLTFSANSFTFPSTTVGSTSTTKAALTLTNTGTTAITLTSFTYSNSEFNKDASSTCGSSLAGSSSCVITTNFTPNSSGTRTGILTIVDSDPSSPTTIQFTGTGAAGAKLTFSANSFTFPSTTVGSTSTTKAALTLTNTGTTAITLTSFTYSNSEFSKDASSTCGSSLAGSSSCVITTNFTPNSSGTRTGILTIVDSDPSSPTTIQFTGTGAAASGPGNLKLSATSFNFGTGILGITNNNKAALTLTNTGSTAIAITSLTYSNTEFTEDSTSTCGSSLAGSSSCLVYNDFTPNAAGSRSGSLTIVDSDPTSPSKIVFSGVGTLVKLSPTGLGFGRSPVNHTSPTLTLTLTNVSTIATLNISQVAIGGANPGDFQIQSSTCPGAINPGGTCTVVSTFTATAVGARSATLNFTDDGGASPQVVQMTGTGLAITTSVKLTSSLNPSSPDQTVTFTATVSPATATGTVQFLDGTTVVGTATLSSGSASFATSALSSGTHSITAAYSGDAIDASSTSSVLVQTVN